MAVKERNPERFGPEAVKVQDLARKVRCLARRPTKSEVMADDRVLVAAQRQVVRQAVMAKVNLASLERARREGVAAAKLDVAHWRLIKWCVAKGHEFLFQS